MNWDAIGAIGEVAGATGVIVTLVYLAIQIRESNRAAKQSAMQECLNLNSQLLSQISSDGELASIWGKASQNEPGLTLAETIQLRIFLVQLNQLWEREYSLWERGDLDDWIWEEAVSSIRQISTGNAFLDWYQDYQHRLSQHWRKYLESVIDSHEDGEVYHPVGIRMDESRNDS